MARTRTRSAAFYLGPARRAPASRPSRQLQGKELSYNNINDTDAAYELVAEFDPNAPAAPSSSMPTLAAWPGREPEGGLSSGAGLRPRTAFGGVIAFNRRLDAEAARKIVEIFTEVIIAPDADPEALAIVAAKKNLRLLIAGALPDPLAPTLTVRSVAGGFLVQTRDNGVLDEAALKVVTKRAPSEAEIADMLLAFTIGKHVKSNAIVYVKDGSTVGIGAGQMSRVDSSRIAALKAKDAARAAGLGEPRTVGSSAASDAFFPFADGSWRWSKRAPPR